MDCSRNRVDQQPAAQHYLKLANIRMQLANYCHASSIASPPPLTCSEPTGIHVLDWVVGGEALAAEGLRIAGIGGPSNVMLMPWAWLLTDPPIIWPRGRGRGRGGRNHATRWTCQTFTNLLIARDGGDADAGESPHQWICSYFGKSSVS
jgi:hypothetical protein